MTKTYILDTNSILNYFKQESKSKRFDKEQFSIVIIEKIVDFLVFNINNNRKIEDSFIIIFDGANNSKLENTNKLLELKNSLNTGNINLTQLIDIKFSGTIFTSTDVIKKYIRLNQTTVHLVSDDFELCTMAINNQNKFIKPDEFILKLNFISDKNFDLNDEISNINESIKHSKNTIQSETFNLLDYFKSNDLDNTIINNTKDGNLRRVPKYEDLMKSGELKKVKSNDQNSSQSSKANDNQSINTNKVYSNFINQNQSEILRTNHQNNDMKFKPNNESNKTLKSLEDLSSLLDNTSNKQSKKQLKKSLKSNDLDINSYLDSEQNNKENQAKNDTEVKYFMNLFSNDK